MRVEVHGDNIDRALKKLKRLLLSDRQAWALERKEYARTKTQARKLKDHRADRRRKRNAAKRQRLEAEGIIG